MRCSPSPSLAPLSLAWDRNCHTSLPSVGQEQPEHKASFPIGSATEPRSLPHLCPPAWPCSEGEQPNLPRAVSAACTTKGSETSNKVVTPHPAGHCSGHGRPRTSPRAQGREGPPVQGSRGRERQCQHLGHPCTEYLLVPFTERSLQIAQL